MRTTMILIALLFALFTDAQTVYYVDNTHGNDTNTGLSQENSWKTIQKACNTVLPNSIVLIKTGVYHENINVNVSGTADGIIVFKNYQNDLVQIDGTGATENEMINIVDKNHIHFENLTIQNLSTGFAKGIDVETSENGTSTGLVFRNITITNINWADDPNAIPTVTDNAYPLKVKGENGGISDLLIDSCHIFNNITGFSEALSLNGNIDGFEIKNCKIHDNTNIGIDIIGHYGASSNPAVDMPRNGIIRNNSCYKNVSQVAQSAGIYIDGGHNITIEKNICYENGFGIEVGCEQNGTTQYITVKNNLIYNNSSTGLAVGGYTTATTGQVLYSTFRNNTLFQNSAAGNTGEIVISKASNCVFEDNLIYTTSQNTLLTALNIAPQQNNLVNYNSWFTPSGNPDDITVYWGPTTYHSFLSYKLGTMQDSNSVYGNPGLTNTVLPQPELQLSESGNCVNTGNPVLQIDENETDFDGNPRIVGGVIDIGAREFQSSLGTNPNPAALAVIVYPNPFTTYTYLSYASSFVNADFQLFDMTGRKVKETRNISGKDAAINRDNLANGLYVYRILQDNKIVASGKIIAQ